LARAIGKTIVLTLLADGSIDDKPSDISGGSGRVPSFLDDKKIILAQCIRNIV